MKPYLLYASCPGVIVGTKEATNQLLLASSDNSLYSSTYKSLLKNHQIAKIVTGSPELDYEIYVYKDQIPYSIMDYIVESIMFRFRSTGGLIRVLDGYWLDNPSDDYDSVEFPAPNDSESVFVGWSQSNKHSTMVLHMQFFHSSTDVEVSGEYTLIYSPQGVD